MLDAEVINRKFRGCLIENKPAAKQGRGVSIKRVKSDSRKLLAGLHLMRVHPAARFLIVTITLSTGLLYRLFAVQNLQNTFGLRSEFGALIRQVDYHILPVFRRAAKAD